MGLCTGGEDRYGDRVKTSISFFNRVVNAFGAGATEVALLILVFLNSMVFVKNDVY